jgi:hypothetical protein
VPGLEELVLGVEGETVEGCRSFHSEFFEPQSHPLKLEMNLDQIIAFHSFKKKLQTNLFILTLYV